MLQIFSALVFLGKCVCTIKCTPKQVTYLYAKGVLTMLHQQRFQVLMRFEYAAQKNIIFFLRTEHGRRHFSSPRNGNGPQNQKTQHKAEISAQKQQCTWATKKFVALVPCGPQKGQNAAQKRQCTAHGRRKESWP